MTMKELYDAVGVLVGPDVSYNIELSIWRHAQHDRSQVCYRIYVNRSTAVLVEAATPYAAYTSLCAKLDPPSVAEACATVDAEPLP